MQRSEASQKKTDKSGGKRGHKALGRTSSAPVSPDPVQKEPSKLKFKFSSCARPRTTSDPISPPTTKPSGKPKEPEWSATSSPGQSGRSRSSSQTTIKHHHLSKQKHLSLAKTTSLPVSFPSTKQSDTAYEVSCDGETSKKKKHLENVDVEPSRGGSSTIKHHHLVRERHAPLRKTESLPIQLLPSETDSNGQPRELETLVEGRRAQHPAAAGNVTHTSGLAAPQANSDSPPITRSVRTSVTTVKPRGFESRSVVRVSDSPPGSRSSRTANLPNMSGNHRVFAVSGTPPQRRAAFARAQGGTGSPPIRRAIPSHVTSVPRPQSLPDMQKYAREQPSRPEIRLDFDFCPDSPKIMRNAKAAPFTSYIYCPPRRSNNDNPRSLYIKSLCKLYRV